jgi:hypothetical protein
MKMAEKPSSRIRFDEIVNAVHADPAKVEPVVMLSGYLGRSSEKGNIRVYPEPSLSCWYEVAESDVVHSAPLSDAPLGGSNVWVRASAKITPSIPIPPPVEAKEGDDAKPQAALADTGVFNPMAAVHPTIWTQFCPTGVGCIATVPCLPPSVGCPPDGGLGQVGPTGTQGCTFVHCPIGQTGWHTCGCPIGPTGWHTCACPIGPTGTQGCTPPHAALAQALPHTGAATICTQVACGVVGPARTMLGCPPVHLTAQTRCFVCDPAPTDQVHFCLNTRSFDCVGTAPPSLDCPPPMTARTQCFHCVDVWTRRAGCEPVVFDDPTARAINPTASTRCFICPPLTLHTLNPTASTHCFVCPPIDAGPWAGVGVQAAAMVGPTGTQGCTQPPHCIGQTGWRTCACPQDGGYGAMNTAATLCTRHPAACPIGETGWRTCACPVGPTGTQGCTQGYGCPSTSTCPPDDGYGAMNTAATLCTRHPAACPIGETGWRTCACPVGPTGTQGCTQGYGCPSTSTCPPDDGYGAMNTAATLCTRHPAACPIGETGWRTCACPQGGELQAAAMVGPTGTQGCTQADCRIGNTGWHTCACPIGPTGTQGCTQADCRIGKTGWHTCACPVITLLTVSGCQHPSWVDACPTRLCMTIAGPCLPYTLGGCFPHGGQF